MTNQTRLKNKNNPSQNSRNLPITNKKNKKGKQVPYWKEQIWVQFPARAPHPSSFLT